MCVPHVSQTLPLKSQSIEEYDQEMKDVVETIPSVTNPVLSKRPRKEGMTMGDFEGHEQVVKLPPGVDPNKVLELISTLNIGEEQDYVPKGSLTPERCTVLKALVPKKDMSEELLDFLSGVEGPDEYLEGMKQLHTTPMRIEYLKKMRAKWVEFQVKKDTAVAQKVLEEEARDEFKVFQLRRRLENSLESGPLRSGITDAETMFSDLLREGKAGSKAYVMLQETIDSANARMQEIEINACLPRALAILQTLKQAPNPLTMASIFEQLMQSFALREAVLRFDHEKLLPTLVSPYPQSATTLPSVVTPPGYPPEETLYQCRFQTVTGIQSLWVRDHTYRWLLQQHVKQTRGLTSSSDIFEGALKLLENAKERVETGNVPTITCAEEPQKLLMHQKILPPPQPAGDTSFDEWLTTMTLDKNGEMEYAKAYVRYKAWFHDKYVAHLEEDEETPKPMDSELIGEHFLRDRGLRLIVRDCTDVILGIVPPP